MQRYKRVFLLVSMLLILVAVPVVIRAQDMTLTYSTPVSGEITDAAVSQTWTLQTESADRLSVQVERTGGNLIPDVSILDSNNQQIQTSYGADNTGAAAVIDDVTLPAAGSYTVQVQRKDADTGVTTGTYTLTAEPLATGEDNPANIGVIGEIESGTPVTGDIDGQHWYQRYSYTAGGPDVLRVTAHRTSGTLFPEVEVLDVNGTSVSTGYTANSGDMAQIEQIELPSAGQFTIAVTRQSRFNGDTNGGYDLTLDLLGAGEGSPLLNPVEGQMVTYDMPLTGSIGARWYDDWQLTTQAGDTLSITVNSDAATSSAEGNLQPEVILLGGNDQELTHGYTDHTGAAASIEHYHLDGPGNYTVRVTRASGKRGETSGPYTLIVALDGAGKDSPDLAATPTGAVALGARAEGEITNQQWKQFWGFQGTAGQAVDIVVQRTDGTLIPLVDIEDSNGQQLNSAYYDPSQDRAVLSNFTLPGDGSYRIVVHRYSDQDGYTAGKYTLLVQVHANE